MASIDPISQPAIPLTGLPVGSPDRNPKNLPASGQNIPPGMQEKDTKPAESEALEQTVKQLHDFAMSRKRNLNFYVDEVSDRIVVTVVNSETNEVVRQIPSEEVLSLARHLKSNMSAILDVLI